MGVAVGLDGHIAHIVQAGLAIYEAVVGRQGVVALLGGHAVPLAVSGVLKSAAGDIEPGQSAQNSGAVLHKAAVCGGVDAQGRQGHDDLGAGFAIHGAPAAKAAVIALQGGKGLQGLIHSGLHGLVGLVVRCQGLDGHSGHIGVGVLAAEGPAAAGKLGVQDHLNQLLPGHITHGGIIVAIQGNKGENGAVDALLLHIGHVIQTLQQVVAAHIGDILADSGEAQDHPGVVGDLRPVQTLIGVSHGLHILHHIVIVPGGHGAAAAGQADDHPLAAGGVHRGGAQGGHEVAGGLVNFLQALALLSQQPGISRFSGGELVIVLDLGLLGLRQIVIGSPGSGDVALGPQGHLADGVDKLLHRLGGLQNRQASLSGGELVVVGNLSLLGLRQCLIGSPGGVNGVLRLQGHLSDGVDLLVHGLGGLQIGQASLGGSELVIALDLGLLGLRQCLIGSPSSGDGALGLQGHLPDGVDLLVHGLGGLQIGQASLGGGELVIALDLGLLGLRQCLIGSPSSVNGALGRQGHLADGIDLLVHGLGGLQIGQASLGGGELVIVLDLGLLGLRQCLIGSPGGGDGLLGPQGHLADGVDLLYNVVYIPALQLQGQSGQLGHNIPDGGFRVFPQAGAVAGCPVGTGCLAPSSPRSNGTGQRVGNLRPILGNGDGNGLL